MTVTPRSVPLSKSAKENLPLVVLLLTNDGPCCAKNQSAGFVSGVPSAILERKVALVAQAPKDGSRHPFHSHSSLFTSQFWCRIDRIRFPSSAE